MFFPQIITEPNSYHGLTAKMKVMMFLCGGYGSKEFCFVGFYVKIVWHIFVIEQCVVYFLSIDC